MAPYAGATTAAIFLSEFVGDVPWAHIDIAGPMGVDADSGWKSKGATGFGTRLLIDLATVVHARLGGQGGDLGGPHRCGRREAGVDQAPLDVVDVDAYGTARPVVVLGLEVVGQP